MESKTAAPATSDEPVSTLDVTTDPAKPDEAVVEDAAEVKTSEVDAAEVKEDVQKVDEGKAEDLPSTANDVVSIHRMFRTCAAHR